MPKTRQQKEETVTKLAEKLGKAKSLVFADYRGLTMKQLSQLRDQLRDQNAEFTITKNTLLERALPASLPFGGPQLPVSSLEGPTALLLSYDDEISPIKTLVKILKDSGIGIIKSGFWGKDPLGEAEILKLASLPSKIELRAKTVGVLAAPLQGMVGVLMGNLRNLAYALDQIKIQKGGV